MLLYQWLHRDNDVCAAVRAALLPLGARSVLRGDSGQLQLELHLPAAYGQLQIE